jgi:predicted O-linked N-acetylglucosamine transferase (SPINDLY family)
LPAAAPDALYQRHGIRRRRNRPPDPARPGASRRRAPGRGGARLWRGAPAGCDPARGAAFAGHSPRPDRAAGQRGRAAVACIRSRYNAELQQNLGETYRHLGNTERALAAFKRALKLRPDLAEAYRGGADTAREAAERAERAGRGKTAGELRRIAALYLHEFALQHIARGTYDRAERLLREAAALAPKEAAIWSDLGIVLQRLYRPSEAEPALRRAIALGPATADQYLALHAALLDLGRFDEARAARRKAQLLDPARDAETPEFLHLLYRDDLPMAEIVRTHRDWGTGMVAAQRPAPPFANVRDPERRLRVGYVSPDFKQHAVNSFIEPLLRHHDPARVEIFCYAEVRAPDDVTARLQTIVPHWRFTIGTSDEELRRQIRADGIDVLIDLAGHTQGNRLTVFAEKPAPVTVTWLGYPATIGLPTIDYRLTDALADPPGATDGDYAERLVRLPSCFLCYAPPAEAPDVAALPALARGEVTFGSFNNLLKLSPGVLDLWARLLQEVPRSRLLLKASLLADPELRRRCGERFAARGVAPERVEIMPPVTGVAEHLGLYRQVDVALDPFPYNGTTTTCESLWMGVPVVSLIGAHHVGRVGLSLLTAAGLADLAVADQESYLRRAAALAADLPALAERRRTLRLLLAASALCDAARFAGEVETALRGMWRRWCAGA